MRRDWTMMAALALLVGCGVAGPQGDGDDDGAGGGLSGGETSGQGASGQGASGQGANGAGTTTGMHQSGSGASGPSSGAGASGSTATSGPGSTSGQGSTAGPSTTSGQQTSSTSGSSSGGTGSGGSGGTGPDGCYTEGYDPNANISDLQSSYSGSQWLPTMLDLLGRRYHNGWFVMDQMKNDPWLTNSFPQYFNLNSWGGMIESVDTACHEEIHGYDFDQALNVPNGHIFYMGSNREIQVPKLNFFPRNVILNEVQQGGSVTSNYDSTYLQGTQGSYDFIFLADELTAYIGGLACATAIADQIGGGHSYRDGAASHLYYLLVYLRIARTQHPSLYNQWQADPDWQDFVRFSWARGMYWLDQAAPFSQLGINDAAIMQRVNNPTYLAEIQHFTGDDAATVACMP